MKVSTILRHHDLTLPQYRVLNLARRGPIVRVASGWAGRGCAAREQPAVVATLARRGLLAASDGRATLTEAGARLIADVEGRP